MKDRFFVKHISDLQLFIAIVDGGSLSAAARTTGISLPTVSRRIRALEMRLATPLLFRSSRNMSPTTEGQIYYASARRLVDEISALENGLTAGSGQTAGIIRITAPTLFGREKIMPAVTQFMQKHPALAVDVSLLDRPVNLIDEGIDVAIVVGPLSDSELIGRQLGSIHWGLIASGEYLKRHGRPSTPKELSGHQCLIYSQYSHSDVWELMSDGRKEKIRVPVRMRANALDCVIQSAVNDCGIALVPDWAVRPYISSGQLEKVLPESSLPSRPVCALFSKGSQMSVKVRAFIEFLAQHFDMIRL
ncbi:MAG: LysR family transcriptional regulator [Kluyvera sp.]|uniref:LysR family transcriptional regulator n=1 Tax=Kluyvera sp. TaxID=1538228 RepID=UPI003A8A287A